MHAHPAFPSGAVDARADRVHRDGQSFFALQASGFARATPQQAWQVLTDYEGLARFIPDLHSSRLLAREDNRALIEQLSAPGFLFLTHSIRLVVQAFEQPYSAIEVALVSGDMQHYEARWELAPHRQRGWEGTRITYAGAMEPDFPVPPLVGKSIVRANVQKMLEATVAEIERRWAH